MKVIVYSTQTCPYCHQLKDYLKEKNVSFEDVDVGSNPEKAQEMIDKSSQMGVPVMDIDGKIIIGFDTDAINEKLGIK